MLLYPVTTTLAGSGRRGFVDGPRLSHAYLNEPLELCHVAGGLFAVVDSRNGCLRVLDVVGGSLHTLATPGAAFLGPRAPLLVDGALAVCDSGHNKVRMLAVVAEARGGGGGGGGCPLACVKDSALAGSGKAGCTDGPAESATFSGPTGLALLPDGSIAVADTGSHAIRRIAARPGGRGFFVTTLAGGGGPGFSDGEGRAGAALRAPTALAVCPATGALLVADTGNHAVRALHPPAGGSGGGWVLTTLAGDGTPGFSDGRGGRLREPCGLAIAEDGTLLVADGGNNCVRALSAGGDGSIRCELFTLDAEGRAEPVARGARGGAGPSALLLPCRGGGGERGLLLLSPTVGGGAVGGGGGGARAAPHPHPFFATAAGLALLPSIGFACGAPPPRLLPHGAPAAVAAVHARFCCLSTAAGRSPAALLPGDGGGSGDAAAVAALARAPRALDGLSEEATFRRPAALCVAPVCGPLRGSLLVSDAANCLLRLCASAELLAYAASQGTRGSGDGEHRAALFPELGASGEETLAAALLPPALLARGLDVLAAGASPLPPPLLPPPPRSPAHGVESSFSLASYAPPSLSASALTSSLSSTPPPPPPPHAAATLCSARNAGASATGKGSPPSAAARAALESAFAPAHVAQAREAAVLTELLRGEPRGGAARPPRAPPPPPPPQQQPPQPPQHDARRAALVSRLLAATFSSAGRCGATSADAARLAANHEHFLHAGVTLAALMEGGGGSVGVGDGGRDAAAAEDADATGAMVRVLLSGAAGGGDGAALRARFARHTSASASRVRAGDGVALRSAPAFVNVRAAVARALHAPTALRAADSAARGQAPAALPQRPPSPPPPRPPPALAARAGGGAAALASAALRAAAERHSLRRGSVRSTVSSEAGSGGGGGAPHAFVEAGGAAAAAAPSLLTLAALDTATLLEDDAPPPPLPPPPRRRAAGSAAKAAPPPEGGSSGASVDAVKLFHPAVRF
jgi:hypothetical protein